MDEKTSTEAWIVVKDSEYLTINKDGDHYFYRDLIDAKIYPTYDSAKRRAQYYNGMICKITIKLEDE